MIHKGKGSERGGIKGSRKGIKHGHSGRQLHETEHHDRMGHEVGEHEAYPSHDGESASHESAESKSYEAREND